MWNGTGTDGFTISVPAADASSMKHLTLWAHSRNTAGTLTAVFADAEGNELTAPCPLQPGEDQLETADGKRAGRRTADSHGLRFDRSGAGSGGSALYLDQIVLSADHAVTNTRCTVGQAEYDLGNGQHRHKCRAFRHRHYGKRQICPVRASNIAVKVDGKAVSGAAVMSGSSDDHYNRHAVCRYAYRECRRVR